MNIALWLSRAAQLLPQSPAIYEGEQLVADYARFHGAALSIGTWLDHQGVRPGARVAIFMENRPEYLPILFGIWAAGAAAVPINAKLHPNEAGYILQNADADLVFTTSERRAGLAQAAPDRRCVALGSADWDAAQTCPATAGMVPRAPGDLAWLFYTSGTTGTPKGVMITHRMLMTMALCYETDVDRVRPGNAAIYAAPMSHGAGLYALMHVRAGARHVVPASRGFDPAEVFALAAHFGDAHMFAAPTMVKRMTQHAEAQHGGGGDVGRGLRTVVYAGGPMYNRDIIDAVACFGPIFVQIYGQGECPMGITALPRETVADRVSAGWEGRLQSVGRAQSAVEVAVAGPDGQPLGPGQSGEIIVRGDTVMPGYWQNPKATARALRDGWLFTGDVGQMDQDGYLTLMDRSKDLIITGGSNVYPREVEEVLLRHPGVSQVAVVGRAHPEWGEDIVAFVVGTASADDLDRLCLDNIARFKRPKDYIFVEDLPKNNYGKVLKTALRDQLNAAGAGTRAAL